MSDWNSTTVAVTFSASTSWTVPMSDWNIICGWCLEWINNTGWTVPMRDWNKTLLININYKNNTLNRTYEWAMCSIHCNKCGWKERKPEQLMSVRQIWIVRVFIFFVVFMHCVLIVKICRYGNRFGDGKCYDRYIKRAWIKIFIVWVFSDSEQIL